MALHPAIAAQRTLRRTCDKHASSVGNENHIAFVGLQVFQVNVGLIRHGAERPD
jgi:hypothetical protein